MLSIQRPTSYMQGMAGAGGTYPDADADVIGRVGQVHGITAEELHNFYERA